MIGAFTFNTSQRMVFERGASRSLAEHATPFLGERPLLVTDKGIAKAGLLAPVVDHLVTSGRTVAVFDTVTADPPKSQVLSAFQMARDTKATSVVGLGGGSSLDVAKLAALLAGSGEDLDQAWGVNQAKGPRLPLILIPTTAGTGSEVTPISIVTVEDDEKRGVVSPVLLPDLAVLDADLTLGLPGNVTAATGVDAMVHAIEAYASKSANNNPLSKALAVEALKLLGAKIETAVEVPTDIEAREAMLLGSMLAGMAFANSPVAAVHALAYPIGGRFHIPHGLSNALVLPHVLRFNACEAAADYSEIAPFVFPELSLLQEPEERAATFVDELALLCKKLGLQTRLQEVGIGERDLPLMAGDAMKQTRLLVNNPRDMTEADALAIYEAAL